MPRLIMPLLCGTFILAGSVAGHAQTSTVTTGPNGVSGSTTVTTGPNGKPCKVVHSDGADDHRRRRLRRHRPEGEVRIT